MRILVTADLHYDIARSRPAVLELRDEVCRVGGDALVLVGDSAGADLDVLAQCLKLFAEFVGRKFFVPGNHCLWCRSGEDSLVRYERMVPQVAASEGFSVLDHEPAVLGEVGLVGSIGWYDYSFRDESLRIPKAFYRAKVAPGAAAYYEAEYGHLIEAHADDLTDEHLTIASRWMDGQHVRLGMSDEQFTAKLSQALARQIEELSPRVERIVAFTHHLPFLQLVPPDRPAKFAFAAAYMGAQQLGRVLMDSPKVTHVYCGHSHWHAEMQIGHIKAVNVGSTYVNKRLEVLEL